VATSSIKRDTRNLIFTLCLRIIKSGYRNINAVILSVIGSTPTTTSVFGTSIHPDLAKLQCEQGPCIAIEAQSNLEKLTVRRRSVNNHNNIKLLTTQVGAVLSQENLKTPAARDCAAPATAVIVQVDGGHIPLKQQDKRSFEALSGVVYRPESIRRIDQHHREINSKSFALSAEDDHPPR